MEPARAQTLPMERPAPADHSYLLAFGFGTSVAMWAVGYVARIPPVWMPSWLLLLLLLACLFGGGLWAAAATGRGWKAGLASGTLSSILNMLILGSLLSAPSSHSVIPSALWWIPGSVLAGALLGSLGGWWGSKHSRRGAAQPEAAHSGAARSGGRGRAEASGAVDDPRLTSGRSASAQVTPVSEWTAAFSAVAAAATMVLLVIGGMVTSEQAGLSVVDWPTSFGYNMFLYPLSRMTGGIYFEHAHRLFGSLVGLTTLVLAIHLLKVERRPRVKRFALGALGLVIIQGILGGLRVTGHFTSSTSAADTNPSLVLAVVHGVTGQFFFGSLVGLAALTSRTWRSSHRPASVESVSTDFRLSSFMVGALLVQLVLGAILRHTSQGLIVHITMAVAVLMLSAATGARAGFMDRNQPILRRLGRMLLILTGLQLVLGISALIARGLAADATGYPAYEVILRTAHQTNGALLLATAVLLAFWSRRLLVEKA